MFLARILFFRLHESPRYLVHAGREEEAAIALTSIAKFNGNRLLVTVADVKDDGEDESRKEYEPSGACRRDEEREGLLEHSVTSPDPVRPSAFRAQSMPSHSAGLLRKWLGKPLKAWYSRMSGLLTGEWKMRTLLIWGIWMSMALGTVIYHAHSCYQVLILTLKRTLCSTSFSQPF